MYTHKKKSLTSVTDLVVHVMFGGCLVDSRALSLAQERQTDRQTDRGIEADRKKVWLT